VLDFHQKRKLMTVVNSPYFQGFIFLLVILMGVQAYERYDIASEMKGRSELAKEQTKALEERKDNLESKVEYLSSDRGIEAEIRRQFDVSLPGEQVVVIVDDENISPEILPLSTSTKEEQSQKWYQFRR
jgi:hypothetical protein